MQIGDQMDRILDDIDLSLLDPSSGQDQAAVLRLALVSAFQYAESMPDNMASIATLKRIEWKYALFLPIRHPGISKIALCQFRQGLFSTQQGLQEFGNSLNQLDEIGLFRQSMNPVLEPSETLSIICQINWVKLLHQTMKSALSLLVANAPEWLADHFSPYWFQRYKTDRLVPLVYPTRNELLEESNKLGKDLQLLLTGIKEQDFYNHSDWAEIQKVTQLIKIEFNACGEQFDTPLPDCATCTRDQQRLFNY